MLDAAAHLLAEHIARGQCFEGSMRKRMYGRHARSPSDTPPLIPGVRRSELNISRLTTLKTIGSLSVYTQIETAQSTR